MPIYYGAPNIKDYIPAECFIDFRDFNSYEELYQFLVSMDAVKAFIKTPSYYEFTFKRYAELFLEQIQAVMNEPQAVQSKN